MSNDDIIKFKEETPNDGYSHISYYLSNTNGDRHPTFTPTSIAMDLTPMLRETLDIVGKATASTQLPLPLTQLILPPPMISTRGPLGTDYGTSMPRDFDRGLVLPPEIAKQ